MLRPVYLHQRQKRTPIEHFDFPINVKRVEKDTLCCNAVLIPDLIVTSYTSRNTEGGGGLELVYDMGNDKNWIEYKLVTAIYQNDSQIYMDNHGFRTEFFSERDEQVKCQVPQIVIDSLVTLRLQEYFKRME